MSPRLPNLSSVSTRERGAVLIQVALAMTVLGGFCAMSIDYGLLMVARGQAQAAADSGALAGVIALGFDDSFDKFSVAEQSARAVARVNLVAQQPADMTDADVQPKQCEASGLPALPFNMLALNCVDVSAYRNRARGNALPTFFGRLVGIGDQGVRAAARAVIVPANASDCVWPLAIPDNWFENSVAVSAPPTFVKYTVFPILAADADVYVRPEYFPSRPIGYKDEVGSGFRLPTLLPVKFDVPFGKLLTLTLTDFTQPTSRDSFVPVQVGAGFASSLASCNNTDEPVTIGDRLNIDAAGTLATALAGAQERIDKDLTARWNPVTLSVEDSCATDAAPCAPTSPRVVVLPVFDPNLYEDARAQGKPPEIRVVNFVGFFISHITAGTSIEGKLMPAPGRAVIGKPMVGYWSAFLRTAVLTR